MPPACLKKSPFEIVNFIYHIVQLFLESWSCSESSVKSFHDAGDVHKAQECDVELVKTGGDMAKNLYALKAVFNPVVRLVAVFGVNFGVELVRPMA